MVKPLCPLVNLFVGVFVWAPALLCVWVIVSLDETQVWLGFAGRLAGLCVVWFVVICLHFRTLLVLVQIDVLQLMLI